MTIKSRSRTPWPKKALFSVLMILLVVICLEAVAFVVLKVTVSDYSSTTFRQFRLDIVNHEDTERLDRPAAVILHPYLGYVYTPEANDSHTTFHDGGLPISDYGFVDDSTPFIEHDPETLVIGIFGGSLAYQFSVFGVDSLTEKLNESQFFQNKKISFVRVALGGYKQPQQVLALTYLLTLGARFDVIINLDGFNEVALPPVNNLPHHVFPYYPRNWYWQASLILSHETRTAMGTLALLRNRRSFFASLANAPVIRVSHLGNLVWKTIDGYLAERVATEHESLGSIQEKSAGRYERTGPGYRLISKKRLFEDLATQWKVSSLQMQRI